jgi:alpha-tubulin suppressor-like RCC1 family protein
MKPGFLALVPVLLEMAGTSLQSAPAALTRVTGWGDQRVFPPAAWSGGVTNIAAGGNRTLTLKFDGSVVGWGRDDYSQSRALPGLSHVVALAGVYDHSLAVTRDGTVAAWGAGGGASSRHPPYAQCLVPADVSHVVPVAAGQYHSLALRDGILMAWGAAPAGGPPMSADLSNVVAIAAGAFHSVALQADGKLVLWGSNDYGQTTVPTASEGMVAIAAGKSHSLAMRADGRVVAWGLNNGRPGRRAAGLDQRGRHCRGRVSQSRPPNRRRGGRVGSQRLRPGRRALGRQPRSGERRHFQMAVRNGKRNPPVSAHELPTSGSARALAR